MSGTNSQVLQVSCVQMHWAKPLEFNLQRTLHYITAAAEDGSRVVLFPEANLTSYYFPYVVGLSPQAVRAALDRACQAAAEHNMWVIVGSIQKTPDRFLNLAHVIDPSGTIVHEYAKVNLAGRDEWSYIREPSGLPLSEAGYYQEEMITAVLDLSRADRSYVLDSMRNPSFLSKYWQQMIEEMKGRVDMRPIERRF